MERNIERTRGLESARIEPKKHPIRKILHHILPKLVDTPPETTSRLRVQKGDTLVTQSGSRLLISGLGQSAEGVRHAFRQSVHEQEGIDSPYGGADRIPAEVWRPDMTLEDAQRVRELATSIGEYRRDLQGDEA